MKYYVYCEPVSDTSSEPIYCMLSEQGILSLYWTKWSLKVQNNNQRRGLPIDQGVTHENCIHDWCVEYGAVEATPEVLQRMMDNE